MIDIEVNELTAKFTSKIDVKRPMSRDTIVDMSDEKNYGEIIDVKEKRS